MAAGDDKAGDDKAGDDTAAQENVSRDKFLGMDRDIARRDFLSGVALSAAAIASGLSPARALAEDAAEVGAGPAPQDLPGYYPPTLTGLRGSHPGSFEAAHALRDGHFWNHQDTVTDSGEPFDLVIVGGGISGLAAAHFYRAARPDARILILENHDDFGGHAKRNEFHQDGRMELMNGGTLEIDSPRPYSKIADTLIRSLGIDPPALAKTCADEDFYPRLKMGKGVFFDRETFGADKLIAGTEEKPWRELLGSAPLSPQAKRDIARIHDEKIDYMPGLTSAQKKDRLSRMSYDDYLVKICKADPDVVKFFRAMSLEEWGVGGDAVSALDIWSFDFPGFQGLDLEPGSAPRMGNTAAGYADGESYKFHFPDGNATIARLLVRNLIPAAIPGNSAEDVVTAHADYTRLDLPDAQIRIRLSSIVVGVRNTGKPNALDGVEIAYTRAGTVHKVQAKNAILACYNMMIPYLCPELPKQQKDALHYLVKIPLVYTSVAIKNWRPFQSLGVSTVYCPGAYHTLFRLNPKTTIGTYTSVTTPNDPALIFMVRVPCLPGLDERSQHRAGRTELLETPFTVLERRTREQLAAALGPAGFDPARDITAITVNRWPHGYAYEYNYLFDPVWPPGQAPHELGRARFGRIAIANSDSGAAAYTDSAIDQAHRAVGDLLALG